jgi:hypothetical protein
LGFKEFAYRASLSVISKNALNFANLVSSFSKESNFLVKKINNTPSIMQKTKTQLEKIREKNIIRVAIVDNKAYFVHENTFYTAEIVNGEVDRSSASPINAFDMSKKEIKKLLSILDNINS